ncbi:MAG: 16S rRNA processing protein RimM [Acidimicrobiia bacterium]|nr:16S rRNA processing protein RimM [Acidimicrobiia bacterium]
MTRPPAGLLEIGTLRRAHGLRGEIQVELGSERPERLAAGTRWWAGGRWLTVDSSRRHQDRWIVTFREVGDRNAAQRLTNTVALAEPLDDPDELWVHELIGSEVVELDGTERGRCVAVVANPAADLMELDSGALVPVVFVVEHVAGRVTISPPPGLFELGATS